ncbi:MAG: hypothetical protein PHI40_03855 [Caldisericia bacterium]|nr:hypothetical protein [Caldisericia bacterium]MDD4614529.1 hypothetical protein [Caldisericia bacterium]
MKFSFLYQYLPLIVSITLILFAIVFHILWFRKPRQEVKIENKLVSYLRKGPIEKETIVSSFLDSDPYFLFSLLSQKLSTIHLDSDTHHRFSDIVFHPTVFDHITALYHQESMRQPSTDSSSSPPYPSAEPSIPAMFHLLMRGLQDERSVSFLQSELDQNDIPNRERMELIKTLFAMDIEAGWMNALSVPLQANHFSTFEKIYVSYMKDFLTLYPMTPLNMQKIPQQRLDYFRKLLFSEYDESTILGLQILSRLKIPSIEEDIQSRLLKEDNTSLVLHYCMEALRTLQKDRAAKILFDYLQSPCVQNSSQLLQKACSCLQDMKEIGQPYIVLAAHSTIPIVRVMAESFLHTPSD